MDEININIPFFFFFIQYLAAQRASSTSGRDKNSSSAGPGCVRRAGRRLLYSSHALLKLGVHAEASRLLGLDVLPCPNA